MVLFEEFAGSCGKDAAPGLPNSPSIGFRLNHVHDLGHVMTERRAKTEQFGFLLRRRYNTANVDARTQNPNLRRQELKLRVIPRPKPLQSQSQEREKEAVHTLSFRSARPARGRENTWYYTTARFSYPQDSVPVPGPLFEMSFSGKCIAKTPRICTLNCTLKFDEHLQNV